jgi:hypothetical protein
MFYFGRSGRAIHLLENIEFLLRQQTILLREILDRLTPRTTSIKIQFGDTMANTVTELVGQSVTATVVPLEADGSTTTPGAVVSAQTWTLAATGVVTLTSNADGSASFVAVAAGTATVDVSATVTDSDGTVGNFTTTGTITVTAPTGRTASIAISFGTPA